MFIEPWIAIGEYGENLTKELEREVTQGHPLWKADVCPLAQRTDRDDVLFKVKTEPVIYAVVHLTWSGKPEKDCHWPETQLFRTYEEWDLKRMQPDHVEYVNGAHYHDARTTND